MNTTTRVSFDIRGDDFNPDEITKRLNLIPNRFWMKGESVNNWVKRNSIWSIETDFSESLSINDNIEVIFNKLNEKRELLKYIKREMDVCYWLEIVIRIKNNTLPGLSFNSDIIEFLNDVGAEIDVDMYSE